MFNLTIAGGLGQVRPSAILAWGLGSWPIILIPGEEVVRPRRPIRPPEWLEDSTLQTPFFAGRPQDLIVQKTEIQMAIGGDIFLSQGRDMSLVKHPRPISRRGGRSLRSRENYDTLLVETHDKAIGGKK